MKPTESELAILNVLWKKGPSTVRTVNTELSRKRRVGYTNTLKMMQLMHDKGLLERDESRRSHVYAPLPDPEDIKKSAIRHIVETVFEGNTAQLMLKALGTYTPSPAELDEIRKTLESMENKENDD